MTRVQVLRYAAARMYWNLYFSVTLHSNIFQDEAGCVCARVYVCVCGIALQGFPKQYLSVRWWIVHDQKD